MTLMGMAPAQSDADSLPDHDWQPLPHQIPPPGPWRVWVLRAGRGSGKTRTGAEEVLKHLHELGKKARVGIAAPTMDDIRGTCFEGESGLMTIAPDEWLKVNRTNCEAWHKSGGYVRGIGTEEPGRWNGPQWSFIWGDEMGLWKDPVAWRDMRLGLRLGEWPRAIITSTPKQSKMLRALEQEPSVIVTHATTFDNPHLPKFAVDDFTTTYGGTTAGRQELYAEYIDEADGAMWVRRWIDDNRVEKAPDLRRIVVGVDPAFSQKGDACETGLCVAGITADRQVYVLDSVGLRASPDGWARAIRRLFEEWKADRVAIEMNYGAPIVESTLARVWPGAPLRKLHASRGKEIRAEPIAALYEQGRVHHVGLHPVVEDQMCSFPVAHDLKDRLDALVWAITELTAAAPIDRSAYRIPVRRSGPLPVRSGLSR